MEGAVGQTPNLLLIPGLQSEKQAGGSAVHPVQSRRGTEATAVFTTDLGLNLTYDIID